MSNIQTGAERMPHDLSHLGFLAGQRSEERFSRNAETDLVCRLLLGKKNKTASLNERRHGYDGYQYAYNVTYLMHRTVSERMHLSVVRRDDGLLRKCNHLGG